MPDIIPSEAAVRGVSPVPTSPDPSRCLPRSVPSGLPVTTERPLQHAIRPESVAAQCPRIPADKSAEDVLSMMMDGHNERHHKHLTLTIFGTLEQPETSPGRLNSQGAKVFYSVNVTYGPWHNKETITEGRARWMKDDRGHSPTLPLEPQLVIRTSHGKHHGYLWAGYIGGHCNG